MKRFWAQIVRYGMMFSAVALALCLTPFQTAAQQGTGKLASIFSNEPVIVDPSKAYPTVQELPGSPFRQVSYGTSSIIEQLAHSSNGVVQLPPGDYSIPIRLY